MKQIPISKSLHKDTSEAERSTREFQGTIDYKQTGKKEKEYSQPRFQVESIFELSCEESQNQKAVRVYFLQESPKFQER